MIAFDLSQPELPVIKLAGPIDLIAAEAIRYAGEIVASKTTPGGVLTLDLARSTGIDEAGLDALIAIAVVAQERCLLVEIRDLPPAAARLDRIVDLARLCAPVLGSPTASSRTLR